VLKDKNINKNSRHYAKQSKFDGSFRSYRTKAVHFLLEQPYNKSTHRKLENFVAQELKQKEALYTPQEIIKALLKDKIIKKSKKHYAL